ncbi:MAG TPA: hypothetical protein VL527_14285, partial [Dongiaceae bacterium]|nr:hypothetical protein [Dongiaceae bacterium]
CSIVMGAMYQLVPVALETRLYSEKLARAHFALHVVGFVGMVAMFSVWNLKQVGHFGSVLALGVGLFVFNLAATLRRVPRWNVTATAVTAALCWLTLTITAGLLIALGKSTADFEEGAGAAPAAAWLLGFRQVGSFIARFDPISAMHAHAHLGGVGLFTMLIVGVSYKLIPMFTLSEIQSRRRAVASVVLLNAGLAGAFVTILRRSPWKLAFALAVVAALIVYGIELRAMLRHRKRRTLDWGIKYFLTAVGLYAPVALLGVVLAWPGLPLNAFTGQLENVYGFLGLLGAVSLAIIGMLYKIVPFLVWFGRYSRQIGRAPVPALADLYSSRLQVVGYWSYLSGLLVTSGAILGANPAGVRAGCGLIALGVLTLAINVALMLSHFFRSQSQPQPQPQPSAAILVKPA